MSSLLCSSFASKIRQQTFAVQTTIRRKIEPASRLARVFQRRKAYERKENSSFADRIEACFLCLPAFLRFILLHRWSVLRGRISRVD